MRNTAQRAAIRAIKRHRKKTDAVWHLITPTAITQQPGKQPVTANTITRVYTVEEQVSEREASHYSLVNNAGLRKILLPGDLVIDEGSRLQRDGVDVNIVKMLDRPNQGIEEYHEMFVHLRDEVPGGSS